MSKNIILAIVMIVWPIALAAIYAEEGYVFTGDIDKDGIEDTIISGPSSMFGNAGGPFILSLSRFKNKIGIGGCGSWVIERGDGWIRLWSYWRLSANSGTVGYTELDLPREKVLQ